DTSLPPGAGWRDISERSQQIQPPLPRSSPCSWCTGHDQTEFAPDYSAEAVPERVHRGLFGPSRISCQRCRIEPTSNAPFAPALAGVRILIEELAKGESRIGSFIGAALRERQKVQGFGLALALGIFGHERPRRLFGVFGVAHEKEGLAAIQCRGFGGG